MLGTRGIWQDGWKAVTEHGPTSGFGHFDEDTWELYHVDSDRSESHDLGPENPEKLKQMIELWFNEAGKYNVLPLDDRTPLELTTLERPSVEPERETYIYFPGTAEVPEAEAVNIRGRSYKILANVDIESTDAHGVLFAHGSRFGGHTLFIKDKKLWYVYNFLGIPPEQQIISSKEITTGKHTLGMEFFKESVGEHGESHGTAKLYIDEDDGGRGGDPHAGRQLHALRRWPLRRPGQLRPGEQGVPKRLRVRGRHDPGRRRQRRRRRLHGPGKAGRGGVRSRLNLTVTT